jgi:hypothetical protein
MATLAFPFFYRHVDHTSGMFDGRITVTGIAQVLHFLLEKTGEFGNMGTVTGEALSGSGRLMSHTFIKSLPIMAGETVDSRFGQSLVRQQKKQHRNKDHYRLHRTKQQHYCALPS